MRIGADTIGRLTRRAVLDPAGPGPQQRRLAWRPDGGLVLVGPPGMRWLRADLTEERFVDAPASTVGVLADGTVLTGLPDGPTLRWTADGTSSRPVGGAAADLVTSADGRGWAVVDGAGAITVQAPGAAPMGVDPGPDHRRPPVALSADATLLATPDGTGVRIRTVPGGDTVGVVASWGPPTALAFDAGGRSLLVATDPDPWLPRAGGVERWDVADPATTLHWAVGPTLPYDDRAVTCLATSAGGRLVAVGTDRGMHLFELADGSPVASRSTQSPVRQLAFGPDGETLALRHEYGLQVWSASGPNLLAERDHGTRDWSAVCFSPDGGLLAVGDGASLVVLWDTARPRPLRALEGMPVRKRAVRELTFAAGGQLVAALDDWRVRVWWTDTGALAGEPIDDAPEETTTLAAHPHQPLLAVSTLHGTRVHDLLAGRVVADLPDLLPRWNHTTAFSPDGTLLAGALDRSTLGLWSTTDWTLRTTIATWPAGVAFTPDGGLLATTHRDRTPRLWHPDGRPGPALDALDPTGQPLPAAPSLIVSPDGTLLVSGRDAWRLTDGTRVDPPPCGHILAFSPDGRHLAANEDHQLSLWSAPE